MGGPGSGARKLPVRELKHRLEQLKEKLPDIIDWLEEAARGDPIVCPECGAVLAQHKIDVDSCKYLVDRIMGRIPQVLEVDITQRVELSADQCAVLYRRAEIAARAVLALPESTVTDGVVRADASGFVGKVAPGTDVEPS